ncbi:hypothetical protein [Conexibacter sp. CPCC 206217]|uniref:hypothetical protein n=1 Tax=Conexibacter sp. CPCC 206217 TaxID=3064574 RepID=UPI0027258E8F|nr:hypothetical protein [Conexibacter sp. CPCC 206217]MDO8211726.1 hypothetical protein [Conexibacter sp. CPCC 206217]
MSTQTTARQLDWSGAEVSDGELTVPLTGERSKRWSTRIEGVLLALQQNAHDGWESVRAKKDRPGRAADAERT